MTEYRGWEITVAEDGDGYVATDGNGGRVTAIGKKCLQRVIDEEMLLDGLDIDL